MEGLQLTVLVHSSNESSLIEKMKVQFPQNGEELLNEVKGDKELPLAIRLSGTFKSAFPDGPPGGSGEEAESDIRHLAQTAEENAVVLIGDSDMILDDFWVRRMNLLGQQMMTVVSDNNFLLQNAVEQLGGDSSLIGIRSRGVTNRPFTVIVQKNQEAAARFLDERKKYQEEEQETARRINELLRVTKGSDQKVLLSEDVQQEIENLKQKRDEAQRKLREINKEWRRETDRLKFAVTWANIALVPFLIAHFGILLAVFRRRRKTFQQRSEQGG